MAQPKVVVKKVKSFPFPAQFKTANSSFSGQIVKLTALGFLAEVSVSNIQPLERMECSFTFPVLLTSMTEPIVTVKIYNQWTGSVSRDQAAGPTQGPVVHLVEMHFTALSHEAKATLKSFLTSSTKQDE